MKTATLSRDGTLYLCKRLCEAAMQRGYLVEVIDLLSCYMSISPTAPSIHYEGRQLPHLDVVVPRIGSAITFYGTAALRQFKMLGSCLLDESVVITRARGRLRSLQLLAHQGIDLPITEIVHSPDDTGDMIDMASGAPLVMRLVEGIWGIGVTLTEMWQATESVVDAFRGVNAHILVQEYIKEAEGRGTRCFAVDDEVMTAIGRRAKEGNFHSNLHHGGVVAIASITSREREIMPETARVMSLGVAGVDILCTDRRPLVMEINASPRLEGVEKTTGADIAVKMIQWIERRAAPEFCFKTGG